MSHFLDMAVSRPLEQSPQEKEYSVRSLRELPGVTVVEPIPEAYVATRLCPNGVTLEFAALEWSGEDDEVWATVLFQGEGTGGSLRELRHTYWRPDRDGYLFYMPMAKTIAALQELQKHFKD